MNLSKIIIIGIAIVTSIGVQCQIDSIAKALVQSPPNGVFYSFSDFMNGKIAMKDSIITSSTPRNQDIWEGTASVTPRISYHNREKRISKLWGFADGKNVYVWNELDFFPLMLAGDVIGFESYGPYRYTPNEYPPYSMLFSGAGAIVYNASLEKKAKNAREFYWFNFDEMSRSSENGFKAYEYLPDLRSQVVLYRRSNNEKDSKINVLINDSTAYDFVPDSYMTMKINHSRLLKVCLDSNPEKCSIIDLGEDKLTYVKVSNLEESNSVSIEKVSFSLGEFESVPAKKKSAQRTRESSAKR